MRYQADHLDDLLRQLYPAILGEGATVDPSRGKTRELVGVLLELTNPRSRLSRTETRGKPFSALGELLWYLSGDNRLEHILPYVPRYARESEDNITVHGGYGPRLLKHRGRHNQIHAVTEVLRASPASRRAVIQIFDAEDTSRRWKEVPCTTSLQFLVRDGKLNLVVTMRSNDAYLGLPHDVFCFTMLQELVARDLGVDLGIYRHFVGSMHIYQDDTYQNDTRAVERYLKEAFQRRLEMPQMPLGNPWPAVTRLREAERRVRAGEVFDAGAIGLDPYWADLVRLLQIHFARGNMTRLDELHAALTDPGYRTFVEGQRRLQPPVTPGPLQPVLIPS
jgi:thymidylate synthase